MTTSQDLLTLCVAALVPAAAEIDATIVSPGDWPIQQAQYPIWKLRLLSEDKASLGRHGLSFTVVTTIRVVIEVSEPAQEDNAGATAAEAALWEQVRIVERTLINSYPLTALLQQFPSIRTQLAFNADGATHLAGAQMDIGMEFFQDEGDFASIVAIDLDELGLQTPATPPTGFTTDLNP